ncbi:Uncharacterised protein [Mycobacteroides abscessus subsp. massiliense]|nr:Uncharacterised protein [Mycobacteroides abscessus subsp. massiliense]SKH82793.1 Uncharacterised protein [Mycobacteroides abscessus subsp. massiliense]SKK35596.1 Uncharacterised protein [Mycobacteroides abscessus subsp. massiliense]SKK44031.1 Uncharacterised protein [Mycobacteroides abscessus subsp. massiliense]SKL86062.1 Uncharacterised protein [Mycobacteroides abscessus subsp. massiliense]
MDDTWGVTGIVNPAQLPVMPTWALTAAQHPDTAFAGHVRSGPNHLCQWTRDRQLCVYLKPGSALTPRRRFMTFIQLRPQDTYGKASDLDVAEPSKSAGSGAPGLIQSDSVKQLNYDTPLADRSHSGHQRKPFRLGARRFLKEVGKPTCWREPARSATTRPGPMQLQTLVLSCRDRQAMAPQSSDEHSPARR